MKAKSIENLGFQTLMVLEHFGRIAQFGLRIVVCLVRRPYRIRRLLADVRP